MASGDSEPKFKDIIALSDLTGLGCDYYAYGAEYALQKIEQKMEQGTDLLADSVLSIKNKGGNEFYDLITGFIGLIAQSSKQALEDTKAKK